MTRPRSQLIGALIALNVAGNLLRRYGLASYLLTSVGIIVGLHFIVLWLATRMPRFLWIAGASARFQRWPPLPPASISATPPPASQTRSSCGSARVIEAISSRGKAEQQ